MTLKTLRCAVYTRKSSDEGLDQEFNSLDAQREACEAYIRSQTSQGWKLVDRNYDDGGFSGGNMERPALKRLISDVEKSRIDVIVVYKIDRLTRSLADFARLVEVLDRHEASFVSVTQQFNTTTSMGRLTLNVLLSFAQFEREVTSERIRDKVAASKRRGMWMGGFPPLGYDIIERKLIVNPREAETVRTIYTLALETRSLTRLEARLARENIRAKSWKTEAGKIAGGGTLTRTTLNRMLRNPVYIGKVRQGGELFEGEQEAIIDAALWDDVQAMLNAARQVKRPTRHGKSGALLSGLLYDDLGNRMVPSHARRGDAIYGYYVSLPLIRSSKREVGSIGRVSAPKIESEIIAALEKAGIAPSDASRETLLQRVQKIILHREDIEILLAGSEAPLRIPADLRSAGKAERLVLRDGANQRSEALIRSIALGHDWRGKLEAGVFSSAAEIAKDRGYSERYVQKILRLGYLAPDIVEAILDGRQPSHLTLHQVNVTHLSGDWRAQRAALGFEAGSQSARP